MSDPEFRGIVPYLFFDDAALAIDWYARSFGFVETSRWPGPDGRVQNAEMRVGSTEIWLDGGGRFRSDDGRPTWVGVWTSDVDAMHARLAALGIECEAPEDKPYGVRTFNVADPFGYLWGFMVRIA